MAPTKLPDLPVPHGELVAYLAKEGKDKPLAELLQPYRLFEKELRAVYAQEPDHEALKDPYVNVLPLFTKDTADIKIRARNLDVESEKEQGRYIMPLPRHRRKPDGVPATVGSVKEFLHNFNVFSESSLAEINWNNVVAAGSSVVNTLLPVPPEFNTSKRALREYYHEKFCPASDVDLFLYGLSEQEAFDKIIELESQIRDSILSECTTVRTKHAITICSQYPTRHIQIVLRIYKSVSEILTGFDIDCSGAAFDGKQVYCTPRALQAYMTQINTIDLSRRSPSYENRLSKYSHRNFEVYWRELDRSRIDPTIFERSFRRTLGLARLLVLERLPTSSARDEYLAKRRQERGRPAINRDFYRGGLWGNIKDRHEDEVAEWVDEEEVSNYHTFSLPYGEKFHAKKIEKLCYTKDLLLNAEWNQPKEREVYLHRHPAFFGRFVDVAEDCCGFCPKPHTEQEKEIAEHEAKTYVTGKVAFIKDDPGRQQIGSFNPLTEDDWTEMAYVGNTARLCQAIVDGDAEHVEDWLAQDGADPNKRDYTGRTPLHLACTSSTPEIVRLLVGKGARLVARLADGRTALHLAAARGNVDIVKILMDKSIENEAEEEEKKDRRRAAEADTTKGKATAKDSDKRSEAVAEAAKDDEDDEDESDEDGESDGEIVDDDEASDDDDEGHSMATGSFVRVKRGAADSPGAEAAIPDEKEDDPDFYDVNVTAWDTPSSALHLAIIGGHDQVVKLLCQEYGADVLLPVKFKNEDYEPEAALLSLCLSLSLPLDQAVNMTKTLLALGATSAQADMRGFTAFHRYVEKGNSVRLLDALWDADPNGVKTSLNHLAWTRNQQPLGPVQWAAFTGDWRLLLKLLDAGGAPEIDFDTWLKSAKQTSQRRLGDLAANTKFFHTSTEQPLILAARSLTPSAGLELLKRGADVNTLTINAWYCFDNNYWRYYTGQTALDVVREELKTLRDYKGERLYRSKPSLALGMDDALQGITAGSWLHRVASTDIEQKKLQFKNELRQYEEEQKRVNGLDVLRGKKAEIARVIDELERLEAGLLERGAKTFVELHPDKKKPDDDRYRSTDDKNKAAKPYEFKAAFYGVTDMTAAREAAYIELFEAAWTGDLDKIKSFTLASWDADQREPPLVVAVTDSTGTNPFAYAFLRGHHNVARGILEIVLAQFSPEDRSQNTRFSMSKRRVSEDYDSDDDGDDDSDDSDELMQLFEHIVDDGKYTIDNIGEISMQVKSAKKPLELILDSVTPFQVDDKKPLPDGFKQHTQARMTLLAFVIQQNDMAGLRFLLDMATHFAAQRTSTLDEPTRFSFPDNEFTSAIAQGRTELLAEIIRRTGAGLPLEVLVKSTGVELKERPKFYQGLTVYGKKRKDWAAAGRQVVRRSTGTPTAPLLLAARARCIESVEWFLSDAPLRHYLDFSATKTARDDPQLKHLIAATKGGFERVVTRWLGNQNELVMHAAVMSTSAEDKQKAAISVRLVEYLLKAFPASVTTKSQQGYTPLFLACVLGRVDLVKLLLPHSDQTTRDNTWASILHAVLRANPKAAQLRPMLDLFDPGLRTQMFKERNSLTAGEGRTPLHDWLHRAANPGAPSAPYAMEEDAVDVLKLLIEYSGGQELAMLDGTGDTPLHTLISKQAPPGLVRVLLDFDVKLLTRENAVGRTAAEVTNDMYVFSRIVRPNDYYTLSTNFASTLVGTAPETFQLQDWEKDAPKEEGQQDGQTAGGRPLYATRLKSSNDCHLRRQAELRDLCREYLARDVDGSGPAKALKRRLVSLHEANDVARRLGERYVTHRYYTGEKPRGDDEDAAGDKSNRYGWYTSGGATEPDGTGLEKDFVASHDSALWNLAWKEPKEEGQEDEDEEDED